MREQKYANVLDDVGENEKETTLTQTRSIRYKELQDELDKDYEKTAPISIDELEKTKLSLINKEKTDEKDEDIFLTNSFSPVRNQFQIKNVFKICFILILLVGLGLSLFFFAIRPLYRLYINSKPINVFYNSIDYISDTIVSNIHDEKYQNGIIYTDIDFELNSNIDDIKDISNNTYGISIGGDYKKKKMEMSLYVKEHGKKYGVNYYEKDQNTFYSVTDSDVVLKDIEFENADSDDFYSTVEDILELFSQYTGEDAKYFIEKNRDIIKDLIPKNKVSSSNDTIEVNGKSIRVKKNTLTLEKKDLEEIERKYAESFFNDSRLVDFTINILDITKEDLKQILEDYTEYDDNEKLIINIYTIKGVQVVGFDIEENGFTDFYYYKDDKNFEGHFNFTDEEDKCDSKSDCALQTQSVFDMTGKFNSNTNILDVEIKYNKEDFVRMEVKSFTSEKIEFTYTLYDEEEKITGDLFLLVDEDDMHLDLSMKNNGEYINLNLNMAISYDKTIANIDTSNAIPYTDKSFEEEMNKLVDKMEDDGVTEGFIIWMELISGLEDDFVEGYNNVQDSIAL